MHNFPQHFPSDCLPQIFREKISYVSAKTQVFPDIPAMMALATASFALQYHVNFTREDGGASPVSLNIITLADSGDRKTSAMNHFTGTIRDYECTARERTRNAIQKWRADFEVWEAEKKGLLAEITRRKKDSLPVDDLRREIELGEKSMPAKPLEPRMVYEDFTPSALVDSMAECWPSALVMSGEASGVLRGRAFSELSALNALWGGEGTVRTRAKGHVTLKWPPRLTMMLMVQPGEFARFMEKRGSMAHDIGFLARALISQPSSAMGSRFLNMQQPHLVAPTAFDERLRELLEQTGAAINSGNLTQQVMTLSTNARVSWINFFNAVEAGLAPGREFQNVRPFASKIAENAVRIAAVVENFTTGALEISSDAMTAGIAIAQYFLHHHMRLFDRQPVYQMSDVQILYAHLQRWREKTQFATWERAYVMHRLPNVLRSNGRGRAALDALIAGGWLIGWQRPEDGCAMVSMNDNPVTPTPAQWINQALWTQ